MRRFLICLTPLLGMLAITANVHGDSQIDSLLEKIRAVGSQGKGHREAIAAMQHLSNRQASELPQILAGMDDAGPLAANWIRAAVETIAQRASANETQLPVKSLESFLADTSHAPRARSLAYQLLLQADPAARQRWIPEFLDDPSLELRRESVARAIQQATALIEKDKNSAVAAFRRTLDSARDIDQIKAIAQALRDQGETVDLPRHFGFVMNWQLIAPFDNTDTKGFDVAYPPEEKVDLTARLNGKDGEVAWTEHTTTDEFGNVDLNSALGKHKGAIGYAYTEFFSDKPQDVELRLGCINANKIWLNGKLLSANEVYHARTEIDQYVGTGRLSKGRNTILLKICQNEQEESWAQDWKFQLRVCDQYGTAVLSQDRPSSTVPVASSKE